MKVLKCAPDYTDNRHIFNWILNKPWVTGTWNNQKSSKSTKKDALKKIWNLLALVFFKAYCRVAPWGQFKLWKPWRKCSQKLLRTNGTSKIRRFLPQNYINAGNIAYFWIIFPKNEVLLYAPCLKLNNGD